MLKIIRLSILSFVVFSTNIQAQKTSNAARITKRDSLSSMQAQTLFGSNSKNPIKSLGFSFSPIVQFGQIGTQVGWSVAAHINNKWEAGALILHSTDKKDYLKEAQSFRAITLSYTPKANSILHLSFPVAIGIITQKQFRWMTILADSASTQVWTNYPQHRKDDNEDDYLRTSAFGIQPGIQLELNLFKHVRIFTSANYRFAMGKESTADMRGFTGQLGMKFGLFDRKISTKNNTK
jgi:hypothetical protein